MFDESVPLGTTMKHLIDNLDFVINLVEEKGRTIKIMNDAGEVQGVIVPYDWFIQFASGDVNENEGASKP